MSTWNDPDMLLDYLRYSFTIADESTACEAVLQPPAIRSKPGGVSLPVVEQRSPRQISHGSGGSSGEAESDLDASELLRWDKLTRDLRKKDSVPYRSRSRTFAKLEAERAKKQRVQQIRSIPAKLVVTDKCDSDLFLFRSKPQVTSSYKGTSLASALIRKSATEPKNPFVRFSKYDADSNPGCSCRQLCIFVPHMSLESSTDASFHNDTSKSSDAERRRSANTATKLNVNVDTSARVSDVIGLICYHYVAGKFHPPIPEPAPRFSLYMADESGEAEIDLPPLDARDRIAKYGFTSLAMVKIDTEEVEDITVKVAVHADVGEPLIFDLESDAVLLKLVRDMGQKHFYPSNSATLLEYVLEDYSVPGRPLSLDATVKSTTARTFYLVRKNCARALSAGRSVTRRADSSAAARSVSPMEQSASLPNDQQSLPGSSAAAPSKTLKVTSGHSKSASVSVPLTVTYYPVMALSRFKMPTAVQFGICPEQIEVLPAAPTRKVSAATRILKGTGASQSSVHSMNDVGCCEVLGSAKGRSTFKVHYRTSATGEWKAYHFESDASHLATIARKLNRYAVRANSAAWAEYARRHSPSRKVSVMSRLVKEKDTPKLGAIGGDNTLTHSSDLR